MKADLHMIPSLDELATNPARATDLPPEVTRALFVRVTTLHGALLASLLGVPMQAPSQNGGDRFLDAAEVGVMIGKSRSWVEKNTEALPKRRKVGGEGKWSEREIQQWMRHRELWD